MQKSEKILFGAGFVMLSLMLLPALILGDKAIWTYHDQLDGEMIAYILQAKHIGESGGFAEFMNGAAKTALTPPAPLSVLLFLSGRYREALFVMQLLGVLLGYGGMYLLAGEITKNPLASWIAGGLYGTLPFLPVYGFSQYGLPMLLWCVLQLRKENCAKSMKVFAFIYGLVFSLNSSLVLVGFAVLAVYLLWLVTEGIAKRKNGCKVPREPLALWCVLLAGYVLTNLSLLGQMLGVGEGVVSHKSDYVLIPENFLVGWLNGIFYGGQHSQDYHLSFLAAGVLVLVLSVFLSRNQKVVVLRKWALGCLLGNVLLAAVSAMWNCEIGITFRDKLGALGAFGMERFLWLSPCLWFVFLACCIGLLRQLFGERKMLCGIGAVAMVLALGISGLQILKNSDVKANVQTLLNPDYPALSYEDYYALGVYDQVVDYMADYTGMDPCQYRVVSLGIDPAAALYHGFYCLDGYSNNYALEYKEDFRKVIAPALEASDYLRDYYDGWGNRCYLFGSECPGYYTIEKGGFYFQHLELDTAALKELGGAYLFSAAYIANAQELNLVLLREEPFETADSYYRIYVYEVR